MNRLVSRRQLRALLVVITSFISLNRKSYSSIQGKRQNECLDATCFCRDLANKGAAGLQKLFTDILYVITGGRLHSAVLFNIGLITLR